MNIAVRRWGNRRGRPIIFIHGFAQSGLAFIRQLRDVRLAEKYHLITYDLRGHGASDKPLDPDAYQDNRLWAHDLRAVAASVDAERPILVAWSFGGRVVWDYLKEYGGESLAGAQLVGSSWRRSPEWASEASAASLPLMLEDDLPTNIVGTIAFLSSCFATPPAPEEFAQMLAYNMTQPPAVRRMIVGRPPQPQEFIASISLPLAFIVGEKDLHCDPRASRASAEHIRGASFLELPNVGHSPFYEDALAFNTQLLGFAERVLTRG
ncbi:alpha/beta hydrolase [Methylocystis iwaonis]|uniref:alpha/beta fold hydrolase n=1 Tax=Methylocystis iwaonis TaxID=2885079 RepID=UPI002E7BA8B9|nr:alpha/beta hydrolase [Methylocystis iwaonis]